MGIQRCLIVLSLLAYLLLPVVARGEDYPIKLTRPWKVGDTYSVTNTVKYKSTRDGKPDVQFAAELQGDIKVLEVNDKNGQPTKVSLTIVKFIRDKAEVLVAGTVLEGRRSTMVAEAEFQIGGKPLDAQVGQVLSACLDLSVAQSIKSLDDMAGNPKPQAVGATWPVNSVMIAQELGSEGLNVYTPDVKGLVQFKEVRKVDDTPAQVIDINYTADNFHGQFPPRFSIEKGSTTTLLKLIVPIDPTRPILSAYSVTHSELTVTTKTDGGQIVSDRSLKQQFRVKK